MSQGWRWNSRIPVELGQSETPLWKRIWYWECLKYQNTGKSTEEIFTTSL